MKVVFAVSDLPWQEASGGKLRDLATYRALREAAEVRLVSFPLWVLPNASTPTHGADVTPMVAPASVAARVATRVAATLRRRQVWQEILERGGAIDHLVHVLEAVRPDVLILGHPLYDGFLPAVRPLVPRLIVDLWEIRSDGARERARRAAGPSARIRAALDLIVLPTMERDVARHADEVWMVTREDAERYARRHGSRTRAIPTTIDVPAYARYHGIEPQRDTLAFVGVYHYDPNVSAAVRLLRGVLPRVRERRPHAQLVLIGRHPPASLRELVEATPNATLLADVPDATEALAASGPLAAPLETGTGMRVKFLEAAAARVPIVTNRTALVGVDLVPGRDLVLAETDEEFAAALVSLWDDPSLRASLVESAYEEVVRRYDDSAVAAAIVRSLRGEPEPIA